MVGLKCGRKCRWEGSIFSPLFQLSEKSHLINLFIYIFQVKKQFSKKCCSSYSASILLLRTESNNGLLGNPYSQQRQRPLPTVRS
jgi:hypothetical protein